MKTVRIFIVFFLFWFPVYISAQDLGQEYIDTWKKFYPSKALAKGIHTTIFQYEDLSADNIQKWLSFNQKMLKQLSDSSSAYVLENKIDARLLKIQVQAEIHKWATEKPYRHSLSLYAQLISKAVATVLEADFLNASEKKRLICQRLNNIQSLCTNATQQLKKGEKEELERALKSLDRTASFLKNKLPNTHCDEGLEITLESMLSLIEYVRTYILPNSIESSPVLGREEYSRRLKLYTDSPLTPEELEQMVFAEIEGTRKLMGDVSKEYLQETYPNQPLPKDYKQLVEAALADMEKDAPKNSAEYLKFWQELSDAAIAFIETHQIATLPKFQTLRIMTAPESAGAAARIGWVASAPPFAPNPVTTLYLPSIPDTLPQQEQIDFWASFNKPFNRMIVIHELFPGHYMQIKISRESPHPVRLLFPYGPYIEGWATFTERVLLDAGWEKENKLTLLAHLRKRLENANRAYTSVQVHCNGWDQQKVMEFSIETSLLAPQFAKSLWGRLMRSPMQITSYFLGGKQFTALLENEKKRLGSKFDLKLFMDTILRAGPIPVDEFSGIFR